VSHLESSTPLCNAVAALAVGVVLPGGVGGVAVVALGLLLRGHVARTLALLGLGTVRSGGRRSGATRLDSSGGVDKGKAAAAVSVATPAAGPLSRAGGARVGPMGGHQGVFLFLVTRPLKVTGEGVGGGGGGEGGLLGRSLQEPEGPRSIRAGHGRLGEGRGP